jgi:Luciferase-like monooxygenase
MKVGLVLPQAPEDGAGATWSEIGSLARHAEAGGIDSLWVCDHFFYREGDGSEVGYHEAWTLIAALAATTTRVELGTLVLATSFRPPGLLAKMAVTADEVSGGRMTLGLGCGWNEPEYTAFGYPFDHRVGRFEDARGASVGRPGNRGRPGGVGRRGHRPHPARNDDLDARDVRYRARRRGSVSGLIPAELRQVQRLTQVGDEVVRVLDPNR